MNLFVVDTNIPIIANGGTHVGDECREACVDKILEITKQDQKKKRKRMRIAIDDRWKILQEYQRNLSSRGQPGVGDGFLKWVLTNRMNSEYCILVSITPKAEDPDDFIEFPYHLGLLMFHKKDRKFVAVASAHPEHPPILQAGDVKWWKWKDALLECGITVVFLCPNEIR